MEKKFEKIYNEILKVNIDELELLKGESNKEKNKPIITLITIMILSAVVYTSMIIFYNKGIISLSVYRILSIILLGILCISAGIKLAKQTEYKTYMEYRKLFKYKIIKPILESFNENLKYYPESGISTIEYNDFKAEKFDIFISEDILKGNINNIGVKIGEVLTERVTYDKDYGEKEIKVFEGLFAKIEIPKQFETEIYIRKQFQQDLNNMKIEMDAGEFNDVFHIYSPDKTKAFEVLTSDFMELLLDFRKKIKIEYDITLKDNIIYIRFHTGKIKYQSQMSNRIRAGGVFEPPEFNKEIMNKENLYHDYAIFYTCLNIINKILNKI